MPGRLINRDQPLGTGIYRVTRNGRDSSGVAVASGVYYYRLQVGNYAA
jgi:hypothetical protein